MLKIGAILAPIGLLLLASRMPSPLREFRRARAFSVQTARRLSSLRLRGRWEVEDHVRRGLVVDLGDGRFYLDPARDRARRRRFWILAGVLAAGAIGGVLWLVPW